MNPAIRPGIILGWSQAGAITYAAVQDSQWNYIVLSTPTSMSGYTISGTPVGIDRCRATTADVVQQMRRRLEEFWGTALPVQLPDTERQSMVPTRRYYRSTVSQDKADAGFV